MDREPLVFHRGGHGAFELDGEAEGWCRDLMILKNKYKLDDVVFVIGGNLSVGEGDESLIVPKFKEYGFDLVFHQIDLMEGLDILDNHVKDVK